jgi:two-component system sensor histidine kinase HydH
LGLKQYIRAQELPWVLFLAALAIFGPHRSEWTTAFLCILGLIQIFEPRVLFFSTLRGASIAFFLKLALCYLVIGLTGGIDSTYYYLMLLPVVSAGTSFNLLGTTIAIVLAAGSYLTFLVFFCNGCKLDEEGTSELVLRLTILPVVGYLAHQLTRKYQIAAEKLATANRALAETEAAMRRSDRLAALGQLSAGLAHELRNPLGTMKASAELLMKNVEPSNEVAHEMAGYISTEVDRTNSLITRFLDFARPLAVRLTPTDLHEILDRAVADIERHQPPLDVIIYKNYSPDIPPLPLDAELMERVIYNLLLNAAQASPPQGHITLKTRLIDTMVEIAVIDRGSGIDSKHLENIFNPFFTTKSNGVGLGLAIVSKIVDEHGGKITVESEPRSGTVFHICLKLSLPTS